MSKKPNFEQSVSQLENIVAQMESEDLGLEEALKLYEEGVKLTRQCQNMLTKAEARIESLMSNTETSDE